MATSRKPRKISVAQIARRLGVQPSKVVQILKANGTNVKQSDLLGPDYVAFLEKAIVSMENQEMAEKKTNSREIKEIQASRNEPVSEPEQVDQIRELAEQNARLFLENDQYAEWYETAINELRQSEIEKLQSRLARLGVNPARPVRSGPVRLTKVEPEDSDDDVIEDLTQAKPQMRPRAARGRGGCNIGFSNFLHG